MAKKPIKYPKKFRATLEKVKAARENREAIPPGAADLAKELFGDLSEEDRWPFNTFGRSFLPRNSVHLMAARVDDTHERIVTTAYLSPLENTEIIGISAPWLTQETDASK
jgi:hypothetical protein